MARYEHLPIYKKAIELSVYLEETIFVGWGEARTPTLMPGFS